MENKRQFNLDQRLIDFASTIIDMVDALPKNISANHLASQVVRSGTAPALHYGEAQGAESRKDFIHKMKIGLKELRETYSCLRIIALKVWIEKSMMSTIINENNELIAIFVKSIATAKNNLEKESLHKSK